MFFWRYFRETFLRFNNKSSAFGSYIMGAIAGGLAQNLSFIVGLKALLLLAAVFYTVAGLLNTVRSHRTTADAPQAVAVRAIEAEIIARSL